jgi:hypothetical protein
MNAYRTKIKLSRLKSVVDIPNDIDSPEVEIIIISEPAPCRQTRTKKKRKLMGGVLSKYANTELIEKEKETAWGRVAEDKHGLL